MRDFEQTHGTRSEARAIGDLVCFSHLRWGFAFQRPQYLMTRFARDHRVFFVEEPVLEAHGEPRVRVERVADRVYACVPHVPRDLHPIAALAAHRALLDAVMREHAVRPDVLWLDTPAALDVAGHVDAPRVVYDCALDLASATPRLRELEGRLLARAHVVFTSGRGVYEAKVRHHANVHAFPSGVDARHFARAREVHVEPDDQFALPRPRAGYVGPIDERIDLELVDRLARERPRLQLVFLGRVRGIDPASLPRHPNLHWLGAKRYAELPAYLAGWDVALLPLRRTDVPGGVDPSRTLEYLAAGLPIAATAIRDAVGPYDELGLVHVGEGKGFARAVDAARACGRDAHRAAAEAAVAQTSWDVTWRAMREIVAAGPAPPSRRDAGSDARTAALAGH